MTFSLNLLMMLVAALICSAVGFYKYVYFISVGYGLSISGQGLMMLFLYRETLTFPIVFVSIILILYGFRLSGYLLIREMKSKSYQKHMKTEIKDGSSMKFFVKLMLYIFCAVLYVAMVSPVFYRIDNGYREVNATFIIGVILMIGGIVFESIADFTKNQAKKKNPKRFCDNGVFKFVRCPNYLGELILWTGVFIFGVTSLETAGQWIIALLGYIGIVFVMFSGARRLEVRQNRNYGENPEYQAYVKSVPILIPFVPLYSVEKYKFLIL